MTSTYTANQGIEKPATGDQSGTWGATVNTNMDIIDRTVSGVGALTLTGTTTTLTTTDGTLTDGMYRVLVLGDGGDLGGNNTITLSPNDQDKTYLVYNNLSADRSAIFTQGTGANATVQNGETAWIYADGGGSGAIVRSAISSVKIADQDGDTQIQVEEGGDDDDTIRFDLAGAEDFTMTANTFNVLSGSDLNINSGGTITNAGTANGFGADAERAMAGVLQANANFVDQVIFGPSVDGVAWNGAWSKASVFSSLMLATIEDEGSNTEINIWDLTEQTTGVISTTPLATVDLSAAATPTSIAAAMGYLIVGSEDGIAIIDPHSGAWAERTTGWPRTLSTSTFPALSANTVIDVGAGFSQQSAHDPRTGGSMPTFAVAYSGGSQASSVIKDDGVVYDRTGTGHVAKIGGGDAYVNLADILYQAGPIDSITADAFQLSQLNASGSSPFGLNCDTAFDIYGDSAASADASGLTLHKINLRNTHGYSNYPLNAIVTRAYNSGYYTSDVRGLWIANSNTVDRSYKGNTLTNNGTVPTATVGELTVYGPFSTSNYLSRASDADWDVLGTGNVHMSCWFETASAVTSETMMGFSNSGGTIRCSITFESHAGNIGWEIQGATATGTLNSALTGLDDGVWHKCDLVQISSTERYIYVDGVKTGVSAGSETTDIGSLSSSGNLPFAIGRQGGQAIQPGASVQLALAHLSATAPSASQVRQMYDGEKGMFVADSECLLQSGSTDAVLDVNVDPLSGKVLVTQTDAITIFDGLVVDSKPTVNSGASEKGKLWGALRAEQNSANAYVTAPATDQRQVNEMVRGLASDLPAGVDLSKAGAWCFYSQSSGATITSSYNIESIADTATGKANFVYSVPFKTDDTAVIGTTDDGFFAPTTITPTGVQGRTYSHAGSLQDNGQTSFVVFGELANE
jgi:hypothetical protein